METDVEEAFNRDLSSLKNSAKGVEETLVHTINRLKVAQHKLKLEVEELSSVELHPRPALRAWLKARNLETESSFTDFFEAFLIEHQAEHRLELSDRTIRLNKDASKLFQITPNTRMSLPEILEKLPVLYH